MNLKAHIRENVGFCFACNSDRNPIAYTAGRLRTDCCLVTNPTATLPGNGRCHRFPYGLQHG